MPTQISTPPCNYELCTSFNAVSRQCAYRLWCYLVKVLFWLLYLVWKPVNGGSTVGEFLWLYLNDNYCLYEMYVYIQITRPLLCIILHAACHRLTEMCIQRHPVYMNHCAGHCGLQVIASFCVLQLTSGQLKVPKNSFVKSRRFWDFCKAFSKLTLATSEN